MPTAQEGFPENDYQPSGDARTQFAMIAASLGTDQTRVEGLPAISSCSLYTLCRSSRRNLGCTGDMHVLIQHFCDGPAQKYINALPSSEVGRN